MKSKKEKLKEYDNTITSILGCLASVIFLIGLLIASNNPYSQMDVMLKLTPWIGASIALIGLACCTANTQEKTQ